MGTRRSIRVFRFGPPTAKPKAYIHTGLHADEIPGMLVTHHLLGQLEAAEARGDISGQVVVIPYANPIGLAQYINGDPSGRCELAGGGNFNRGWPDLSGAITDRVDGRLGEDGDRNVAVIRDAMRAVLDETDPARELDALRIALAREAWDADLVLDLHCDDDALMHLFVMKPQWLSARDLAGELGCRAVLLADDAGGVTFTESCYRPWARLASAFPGHPVPRACLPATVELRGYADVSDELAAADAKALFRTLQRHGQVAGDPGPSPVVRCEPTGLDACDILRAPAAGVVSYRVELGQEVSRGDPVADIIDIGHPEPSAARHTIRSRANGLVLSRRLRKLVAAGEVVAKIAGSDPLTHRQGYLLED